jgi:hypothetical protein
LVKRYFNVPKKKIEKKKKVEKIKCFLCDEPAVETWKTAEGNEHEFCGQHAREVEKCHWIFVRKPCIPKIEHRLMLCPRCKGSLFQVFDSKERTLRCVHCGANCK